MTNSVALAPTGEPSVYRRFSMIPETRERTSTSREPSACPTASIDTGTRCNSTRCTVTGMAGGGPPAPGAPFAAVLAGCLLQAATTRTRLGYAHRLRVRSVRAATRVVFGKWAFILWNQASRRGWRYYIQSRMYVNAPRDKREK